MVQKSEPLNESHNKVAFAKLEAFRQYNTLNLDLPACLVAAKRYRLALEFIVLLVKSGQSQLESCATLALQCLKHYTPSTDEIDKSAIYLSETRLSPHALAVISINIKQPETEKYFLKIFENTLNKEEALLLKALVHNFNGDSARALSIAQALVAKDIRNVDAAILASEILLNNNYTYAARRFACLAVKHDRDNLRALEMLALTLQRESRWRSARVLYRKFHEKTKDDISLLNSLITLPVVEQSPNDLSKAVEGFGELNKLLATQPQLMGIEESLQICTPLSSEFYLAYEGPVSIRQNLENSRNFVRLSANKLISQIAVLCDKDKDTISLQDPNLKRIRVGFISRNFFNHSNLEAHYGLISKLDRGKFEVIIIHRSNPTIDDRHLRLNSEVDKVVYLQDDFRNSCKLIHSLELDFLFFTDIGMGPLDSLIAMPHLARYQITSWGLPHTTGVKEIDIYARSAIFSDCETQDEYTERLVTVNGYFGYFSYDKIKLDENSRDFFLLPPDRFLVGCLQSTHKLHPDFDIYLNEIAKIHESILIIMVPSEGDRQMEAFVRRIKKTAPRAYEQLCLLQRTTVDDFYSLNAIIDLNLDTIYYGAGVTFVQTTWCGPPYITQSSNMVRASVVSASYRYMGITKPPIAQCMQGYVDLVRYYFEHRSELQRLREEIHEKSKGKIYNNNEYIEGYQELFCQLAQTGTI